MPVETPAPVTEIRQADDAVYAWAGDHWFEVSLCNDQPVCMTPGQPPEPQTAPDGIPNGTVAYAGGEGITSAWYSEPTDRYPHGALGDKIEAGAMVVQDVYGHRVTVELPADQVFEDLTPRIADLDGDGRNEVLAIRSSLRAGAALVAYDLAGSSLIEINSTPPVGRPTAGSTSPASPIHRRPQPRHRGRAHAAYRRDARDRDPRPPALPHGRQREGLFQPRLRLDRAGHVGRRPHQRRRHRRSGCARPGSARAAHDDGGRWMPAGDRPRARSMASSSPRSVRSMRWTTRPSCSASMMAA